MDVYPPDYVHHNLPLIFISGLASSSADEPESATPSEDLGTELKSELPPVVGGRSESLLREILDADGSALPWNAHVDHSRTAGLGFRVKAVGRRYTLPPKKSKPPLTHSDGSSLTKPIAGGPQPWVLHSPISPLTPGSPVYPDGVVTPLWLRKHDFLLPSVVVSFIELTLDPNYNKFDDQIKSDINGVKAALTASGYRTRLVVVLMCEKSVLQAPELDERMTSIKRGTGLDSKSSLLFLPPGGSRAEHVAFVKDLFSLLRPLCMEYYRDLTKHARRKKNRGYIPPPTAPPTRGTSQTLSLQGWGARYEFKQGVFAELRQEMDVAGRHYTSAFDALLGSDGIFETTASWSPRWDEARLLADAIAIRILRCLLWNELPTSAVQSWINYRDRIRDLVDRRGKGSLNYGWAAWESRWAKIMAEMIVKTDLFSFATPEGLKWNDAHPESANTLYLLPEDIFAADEPLRPWEFLHHPGYWLHLSASHAYARKNLAQEIPEEDRNPPGQSPATQVAHRLTVYDTYLCPHPHIEMPLPGHEGFVHSQAIVDILDDGVSEFFTREQQRFVDKLKLQTGQEYKSCGDYPTALNILKPLWQGMVWRSDKWWALASEVTWALHECASMIYDAETLVATEAEMMCDVLPRPREYKQDFQNCLEADEYGHLTPSELAVVFDEKDVTSFLKVSFAFLAVEGHVGEPLQGQLSITSTAHASCVAVTLSKVELNFEGVLSRISLQHGKDGSVMPMLSQNDDSIMEVPLRVRLESSGALHFKGEVDLTITPGQTRVYSFSVVCREVGHVRPKLAILNIKTARFEASFQCSLGRPDEKPVWWLKGETRIRQKLLGRDEGAVVKILPKPPKMDLRFPVLAQQYYIDELIVIDVELMNGEDQDTEAVLEGRLMALSEEDSPRLSWVSSSEGKDDAGALSSSRAQPLVTDLPGHSVGILAPSARRTHSVTFQAPTQPTDFVLEVKVLYHLLLDRATPVSKTTSTSISVVRPFEANYDFIPRLHPDPWPSFFDIDDAREFQIVKSLNTSDTEGITHRHCFVTNLVSFAKEQLIIENVSLDLVGVGEGLTCKWEQENGSAGQISIAPEEMREVSFILDVKKLDIEERSSAALDIALKITWRRQNVSPSQSFCSTLVAGRFFPAGNDFRVLASVEPPSSTPDTIYSLTYTLENPTMHFVILNITMDVNTDFAFSGPKAQTIKLLPISRTTLNYRILPTVRGAWIVPSLKVLDRYFGKSLRVIPVGEKGIRADKRGIAIWIDGDGDDTGARAS